VVAQAQRRGLLSGDRFTVNGTLLEAWAGLKSVRRKGEPLRSPDDPRNPIVKFHGEKRHYETPRRPPIRTRSWLAGDKREAKLSYVRHVVIDNRHGLVVNTEEPATRTAECTMGIELATALPARATFAADRS
jgi:hypothetical protein